MATSKEQKRILSLLSKVKRLAKEYYELTGRPLGVTGEIGEYEAAELLSLNLADVRQAGYDAVTKGRRKKERFQIKTRVVQPNSGRGQRTGTIDLTKEWDAVLLVLLDSNYDTTAIYRAERQAVQKAVEVPGSKTLTESGELRVAKFKAIARQIWPK